MNSLTSSLAGLAAVLALGVLTGCGARDTGILDSEAAATDLAGLYEVTSLTGNYTDCDAEGGPITGADAFPYFMLKAVDESVSFVACTSSDPSSCSSQSSLGAAWEQLTYAAEGGDTFRGTDTLAVIASPPPECWLNFYEGILTVESDTEVRVEARAHFQKDIADESCSEEKASDLGTDMPCKTYEVVTGRR